MAAGRLEEAVTAYDRAIEQYPEYDEFWHGKGLALHALGRDSEAEDALARARELGYES
jgi:Flp pilus assembly protein TadD